MGTSEEVITTSGHVAAGAQQRYEMSANKKGVGGADGC
jgi:hypothetical protein